MARHESPERPRLGKSPLRREVLGKLASIGADERAGMAAAATARLLALPELAGVTTVAAYASIPPELPTDGLLAALVARGVRVLLPALREDASLAWRAYDGPLVAGPLGTLEATGPGADLATADVVVVPGVAFDPHGNRLGRGGGSYDRALAGVRVPVVALAADVAVVPEVPAEPHDRPVDVVVTPTRVLRPAATGWTPGPGIPHH